MQTDVAFLSLTRCELMKTAGEIAYRFYLLFANVSCHNKLLSLMCRNKYLGFPQTNGLY
jgi:hypothetical protein